MIVEESDNQIDPYTKKPIEHPVRSRFCNHAFEKTSIMQIIAQEKRAKGRHAQLRLVVIIVQILCLFFMKIF